MGRKVNGFNHMALYVISNINNNIIIWLTKKNQVKINL